MKKITNWKPEYMAITAKGPMMVGVVTNEGGDKLRISIPVELEHERKGTKISDPIPCGMSKIKPTRFRPL